jgi:hypothetical protein
MYRSAGLTRKISKTAQVEICGIHRIPPIIPAMSIDPGQGQARATSRGRGLAYFRMWEERVVRMSPSLVAPSAMAILSTALLCGLSSTAAAQTTPSSPLPGVTVTAPEPKARPPQRQERAAGTGAVFRRGPAPRTAVQRAGGTPSEARGPIMAKLARLEREASSCNDGCESSFPRGKDPWVGCSESVGYYSVFSATCKDTLTHRDYAQCVETKMFLGWDRNRSWWYCTGMLNGGKFRVTAENRNR